MGLSVVIITLNEEKNLEKCLASICWAEDIVVVDSGSEDGTEKIARQYTERFYTHHWEGYSVQKQRAIDYAKEEWVLSLDADEELSIGLQTEIRNILKNPLYEGYKFPRHLVFQGAVLKYAEGHSKKFRLFKKGCAQMDGKRVHEGLVCEGRVGELKNPFYHHSFHSLEDTLRKLNTYSTLSAEEKAQSGEKGGVIKGLVHGMWTFVRFFFLGGAFLHGGVGFVFSFALAEGSYYRYVKLAYDQKAHVHSSCRRKFRGKSSHHKDSP